MLIVISIKIFHFFFAGDLVRTDSNLDFPTLFVIQSFPNFADFSFALKSDAKGMPCRRVVLVPDLDEAGRFLIG